MARAAQAPNAIASNAPAHTCQVSSIIYEILAVSMGRIAGMAYAAFLA